MQASIVDLRYKSNDILSALDLGEEVVLLYRGKPKGTIKPLVSKATGLVAEHPFFAMNSQADDSVEDALDRLRGSRYDF